MAFKRPAIFVPFPFATDDHQLKNALAVQATDWVIPQKDLSWEKIGPLLRGLEPSIPKRKVEVKLKWESVLKWLVGA